MIIERTQLQPFSNCPGLSQIRVGYFLLSRKNSVSSQDYNYSKFFTFSIDELVNNKSYISGKSCMIILSSPNNELQTRVLSLIIPYTSFLTPFILYYIPKKLQLGKFNGPCLVGNYSPQPPTISFLISQYHWLSISASILRLNCQNTK